MVGFYTVVSVVVSVTEVGIAISSASRPCSPRSVATTKPNESRQRMPVRVNFMCFLLCGLRENIHFSSKNIHSAIDFSGVLSYNIILWNTVRHAA